MKKLLLIMLLFSIPIQAYAMNNDQFWNIIDATKKNAGNDQQKQIDALHDKLTSLGKQDLLDFAKLYRQHLYDAYSWGLLDAVTFIDGGSSDDRFEYFRDWLISQGHSAYDAALKNPDSLASIAVPMADFEQFRYVVIDVYKKRYGSDIRDEIGGSGFDSWGIELNGKQTPEEEYPNRYPQIYNRIKSWH